jgi:hypothetical protein
LKKSKVGEKMVNQNLDQLLAIETQLEQINMCTTVDMYASGTIAWYTPPPKLFEPIITPIGGLGSPGGVLHEPAYLEGGLERYRYPEWDPVHGHHLNYETLIPGIRRPILNIHIPMEDMQKEY